MSTEPLDVAIDVGPLYGHRTGVGVATAGMLEALGARADVAVVPYLTSFRSTPAADHRRLPLPGIVASHLWSRADRPRADRWLGTTDVLHGTNYVAPPSSAPTVISVYDCWFLRHPESAAPLVRRAGRMLRRRVAAGAWIHASSEATADQARELLATDRVVVVHLGPPPVASDPAASGAEPSELRGLSYVLAIGTEERRKNLPVLVEAFAHAASADADLHLVLAGAPGDDTETVDAAIARLDGASRDRVHRLGVVDGSTKVGLLRHAAVLAYPSLDEGFGFPILEAQAAGVPVVASDVGSIGEIAGAGAVLVSEPTAEALASDLCAVVDGTHSRLGLITAGHENLGRFSWSSTADGLVDLYRRAMAA